MKGKIYVDYSKLKDNTSTPKSIISKPSKKTIALPEYEEQLILKRSSQNTIKTYSSCFLKFMAFFENKSIDLLTKKEIKTFLLRLIQDEEGNKLELWEPIDHVFTAMGGATTK